MMLQIPDGFKGEWEGLSPALQQFIKRVYEVAEAVESDDTPPDIVFEFFGLLDGYFCIFPQNPAFQIEEIRD